MGRAWTLHRIDRAPAGARVEMRHYVPAQNHAARRLLEAHGYAPVRGVYVMSIILDAPPPAPEWPETITAGPFIKGQDERALFEAHEDAFRDLWGRPPGAYDSWERTYADPSFDPSLWFIARDRATAEIAGYLLCRLLDNPAVGASSAGGGALPQPKRTWIGTVGGRHPWRRQGIALALLYHAFAECYRRGAREVGLSVDA